MVLRMKIDYNLRHCAFPVKETWKWLSFGEMQLSCAYNDIMNMLVSVAYKSSYLTSIFVYNTDIRVF